jgi:inosine/xanthosine triphosphatase
MVYVLVGSKNPVKLAAVQEAFGKYFYEVKVEGVSISSSVPEQPIGLQTYEGARNRVQELYKYACEQGRRADYYVGLEGGIEQRHERWFSFGCMCIMNHDNKMYYGLTPHVELPEIVVSELLNGGELGPVMDKMVGEHNIKQNQGTIGILSKGVMNRTQLYVSGLVMALVPFVNEELYKKK